MSFLESKVQSRYNDATRAEVERKLKLEHAKLNEDTTANRLAYQVKLQDSKTVDNEYVLYQIQISKGSQQWSFQSRYSLLYNLQERLPSNFKKSVKNFPEKRFFGNLDTEFLSQRYTKLEEYLESLFANQEVLKSEVFQAFVKQSKLAAISINDPSAINNFRLDY